MMPVLLHFKKYPYYIIAYFILILAWGYDQNYTISSIATYTYQGEQSNIDVISIILNNLGVAVLILSGAFTFQITSLITVAYSAFIIGLHVKKFSVITTFNESLILIGPHLLLEMYWLILMFQSSLKIQIWFTKLLNNNQLNDHLGINEITRFSFAISLIFVAAFVESHYSPLIFKYFTK